jgi:ATP-dependent DNA helicase RecG
VDDESVLQLIKGGESEQIERKEQLKNKKTEVCRAICAFANDFPRSGKPGFVVIGQHDKGHATGLPVTDELLRELSDLRKNGLILPFPQMSVRKVPLEGTPVAVVIVEPSSAPPLRYDGRTWIRVGSTTRLATAEEEAILTERLQAANLPFDARPVPSATIADLDVNRFRDEILPQLIAEDVLQENHRPIHQQMASLQLVSPGDFVPTATGLLLVGRDPQAHLPGSYTQFVRFDGAQLFDPIRSEHQVTGTIPDIMLEVEEILRANIDTVIDFVGLPTERRTPSVPFEALQQLYRNALLHRTYESSNAPVRVSWFDDRVEIQSPGGPFGQVTVETIGQPGLTDYRNPTLAGVLNRLGFVQRFGVGIQVSRDRLAQNGNPPLDLQASVSAVAAIVGLKS